LFERGVKTAWSWAEAGHFVCWFSDGERRYRKQLWSAASVWLKPPEGTVKYGYRKVWREGVEVAMNPISMTEFLSLRGFDALPN
jgi:hypothetical protein